MAAKSSGVEAIFFAALEKSTDDERAVYLNQACGQDTKLRERVEKLLDAQRKVGSFLEDPPQDVALDSSAHPQPGTCIGPYKLLQELGEGGFGVVYMAEQQEPIRRQVALKIIKPGMDTREVIARFEAERQALAMMDHANIARVFDAGATETGRPYFVMELVKGLPITEFCDQNRLETEQRLHLFITVCRAVQHAHQKGVIHRDLKPSNIMITLHDGEPVPKVIDFGVSKAISLRLTEKTMFTRYGQMVGTPQYMSPEQAEFSGLDADTRSDIYSLGVLLYELLTGTTPLASKRLLTAGYAEMLRMIKDEEAAKPSTRLSTLGERLTAVCEHRKTDAKQLRQLIRGDLDWIVMKALEKRRERRYETVNGLALDIQRHLHQEPVVAGPPSATYRFRKLVQRNRIAFTAGAVVLAALVIGLAAATWGLAHARAQRARAEAARQEAVLQRNDAQEAKAAAEVARSKATAYSNELERQVYAMHLADADHALLDKNLVRAGMELEACSVKYRSWVWQFLADRAGIALSDIMPASGQPHFTRDGQRVMAIGRAETNNAHKVIFWDLSSQTQGIELNHEAELICLALSADDRLIAASDVQGTLFLWNRQTHEYVWRKSLARTDRARALAFHPQGSHVASINDDYVLNVFATTADGGEEFACPLPVDESDKFRHVPDSPDLRRGAIHEALFNQKVAFSPDGRWIAVGGMRRSFLVDTADPGTNVPFPPYSKVPAFSPTETGLIATGNPQERTVSLWRWDGRRLQLSKTLRAANSGRFHDLCFSADGSHLVAAQGKFVTVWDVDRAKTVAATQTGADERGGFTYWLAMSPTENVIACCGDKGDVLWGGTLGLQLWKFLGRDTSLATQPRQSPSQLVKFSPQSDKIAIGTHRGQQGLSARESPGPVIVVDARSGVELSTIPHPCLGFAWTPDGQQIVVSRADDQIHAIYDGGTGDLVRTLEGAFAAGRPYVTTQTQRMSSIRSESDSLVVRTWDTASNTLSGEFSFKSFWGTGNIQPPIGEFWSAAVSPAGDRVAVAAGADVRVWDTHTETELPRLPNRRRIEETLAFTAEGDGIYLTSGQKFRLYDVHSNRSVREFTGPSGSVALSPDKQHVVSCGDGVVVWDVQSGMPVLTLAEAQEGDFISVDWSSDQQRIAAGRADGTVRIWQVAPGR